MLWINLQTTFLRAPEFAAARPTERATWLCLLGHCCEQENGGRMPGARAWDDRRWRQLGVTRREVLSCRLLLRADGDDLVVRFYPLDKQQEVQRLRAMGAATARHPDAGDAFSKRRWSPPAARSDFLPPPAPAPTAATIDPPPSTRPPPSTIIDAASTADSTAPSAPSARAPTSAIIAAASAADPTAPSAHPSASTITDAAAHAADPLAPHSPAFRQLTRAGARHTATTGDEWRRVVDRFGLDRVCALVAALPTARDRWPGRVEDALEQQDADRQRAADDHTLDTLLAHVDTLIARDGWLTCRERVGFPPATVTTPDDLRTVFRHNRAAARLLLSRSLAEGSSADGRTADRASGSANPRHRRTDGSVASVPSASGSSAHDGSAPLPSDPPPTRSHRPPAPAPTTAPGLLPGTAADLRSAARRGTPAHGRQPGKRPTTALRHQPPRRAPATPNAAASPTGTTANPRRAALPAR
jgi:hypothetical protein